jgi:hypothetical protein
MLVLTTVLGMGRLDDTIFTIFTYFKMPCLLALLLLLLLLLSAADTAPAPAPAAAAAVT